MSVVNMSMEQMESLRFKCLSVHVPYVIKRLQLLQTEMNV